MSIAGIVILWFVVPFMVATMIDNPHPLWLTPIGLLAAIYFGLRWFVRLPAAVQAARDARTEADYQETLALIDWRETPRTTADEIQDALELERPE